MLNPFMDSGSGTDSPYMVVPLHHTSFVIHFHFELPLSLWEEDDLTSAQSADKSMRS